MTDLEKHVNRPGRDKQVKKVREKINELGITYIYYQFISVTGRVVGKGIPADHWERTAEKGFQLVYGATANLFLDRHNNYIGYGPEAMELVGIPDPETFCQLPWGNRPNEAADWFERIQKVDGQDSWARTYRLVVLIANWQTCKASWLASDQMEKLQSGQQREIITALRDLARTACFDPRGPIGLFSSLEPAVTTIINSIEGTSR